MWIITNAGCYIRVQMTTVWLTVLVSGERYVAICRPLHAAVVCTVSRVRLAVLSIVVVSVLFNVPRYFEVEVDVTGSIITKSAIGSAPAFRILYTSVLYAMALFVVPLGLLIYLNVRLVLALRRGRAEWLHLQMGQRREQTLTAIPLTIVLVFFVCGTPSLIVNIIDSVDPNLPGRYSSYVTLMVVANFLVVVNSASNIIIYCLVGSQFRNKLVETLTALARDCRRRVVCGGDSSPTSTPTNSRRADRCGSNTTSVNLAVISAGCDAIVPLPTT